MAKFQMDMTFQEQQGLSTTDESSITECHSEANAEESPVASTDLGLALLMGRAYIMQFRWDFSRWSK